jgi:hypothetical protein
LEYIKTILLVVGPYIAYSLILKWLEDVQDVELSKLMKAIIFITIDLIILMIFY